MTHTEVIVVARFNVWRQYVRKVVWVGLLLSVLSISICIEARGDDGTFKNLGTQITATTLIGTTFTKDADGTPLVCTVMRGQPAKLVVFDLKSGKIVKILPLIGAEGAWNATTASDGSVYIGTDSNGHLYRWIPGEDEAKDLGQVSGQTWVWDVAAGKDGEVFLATYDGCEIVRYRPDEGFKEISTGPASPGEQYARAVAYDPATGKVYAGVGSHAHLVEINPATGKKNELLPPEYSNQEFVYGVNIFGHYLFALVTNLNKSLVFDLNTKKVVAVLPEMSGQQVMTKSPVDDKVYYVVAGHLHVYDMAKVDDPPKELVPCPDSLGMSWEGDSILVVFTRHAGVLRYDTKTGNATTTEFETPAEPVVIESMATGPEGRIWMGGYLSGGNAAYDPATGKSQEYKGLSQAESIGVLGNVLYFGLYPHGRFAMDDTTQEWKSARANPKIIGKVDGQSRPFAGLGVPELKQVFFGTVPEYGTLGGGIADYDPAAEKLSFFGDIVKDQSVIALVYADKMIIGGTSIFGGLGQKPSQSEGKLFIWDPRTKQKVFESVPVPGSTAVTCLMVGPDKKVWGLAEGTLFIFDPATKKVIFQQRLFDIDYQEQAIWRDGTLILHPLGQIYGTAGHRFFRLDPETKRVTLLRDHGAQLLAMDRQGRLYFRDRTNLWQYTP